MRDLLKDAEYIHAPELNQTSSYLYFEINIEFLIELKLSLYNALILILQIIRLSAY